MVNTPYSSPVRSTVDGTANVNLYIWLMEPKPWLGGAYPASVIGTIAATAVGAATYTSIMHIGFPGYEQQKRVGRDIQRSQEKAEELFAKAVAFSREGNHITASAMNVSAGDCMALIEQKKTEMPQGPDPFAAEAISALGGVMIGFGLCMRMTRAIYNRAQVQKDSSSRSA